jgi:drug/metabolite transporter (DMT)-like permease
MAILFALLGSAVLGSGDYVGGATSRVAPPLWVATLGQCVALVLAVPVALLDGSGHVTRTATVWSFTGGAVAAVGLGLFYSAMSRGLISLVVPITSVVGAALPVAYGLGRGERPGNVALTGIVLALIAVAVVSALPGDGDRLAALPIAYALGAGACFGMGLICFSRVGKDAGLWPVALSRTTTSLGLVVIALALSAPAARNAPRRVIWRAGILIGLFEVAGNAFLFLALERGSVAVVSVLISLYPVTTVLLATALLGERLSRVQLAGVVLALGSVALISSG